MMTEATVCGLPETSEPLFPLPCEVLFLTDGLVPPAADL